MSDFSGQLSSERERSRRGAKEAAANKEEHDFNSFKGSAKRNNDSLNYQKIPGKIRKQNVDMPQPGDGRRDSSALNQQIMKGLQQVEPVINN